jgi:hypothetical protein
MISEPSKLKLGFAPVVPVSEATVSDYNPLDHE